MTEKCNEIEELHRKHDYLNTHRKIKEITYTRKNVNPGTLIDTNAKLIADITEKLNTWKQYIQTAFSDDRPEDYSIDESEPHLQITKEEIEKAIYNMHNNKAPGPDDIRIKIIKILCDSSIEFLKYLEEIFNFIYDTGKIPPDWLISSFIAIPKTTRATTCDQYRLISLINNIVKVFTKVVHNRIYQKCDLYIDENQFGFRNALGTREAIFSLQVLIQRCRDVNHDVYACFIDFTKAFDRVEHTKLIQILKEVDIDSKDIQIIINLYWNQTAYVNIEGNKTENVKIKKGVRQGCVHSPTLFNIYSENIFQEAPKDSPEGIIINGENINNFRYADDTVIVANSPEELQTLLTKINATCEEYGISINISKTKYMTISKNALPPAVLTINNQIIEQVQKYNYLGTAVNANWDPSVEIRYRIEKARSIFNKMKTFFVCKDINLQLKIRMIKCYIFPVLLYGVEA